MGVSKYMYIYVNSLLSDIRSVFEFQQLSKQRSILQREDEFRNNY